MRAAKTKYAASPGGTITFYFSAAVCQHGKKMRARVILLAHLPHWGRNMWTRKVATLAPDSRHIVAF
jgi:hypothetical protein